MTNWKTLIAEMREHDKNLTLQEIADATGMSKGAVHDLVTGRGKQVLYDTGMQLMDFYKRVMRRKAK